MPFRRFRRQYDQLPQFERGGRIICVREAGWSARRVAHQLGCSDCVVRRCWDHWIKEMSFTRPGTGCPRQISRREDHYIVRNARVLPTVSSDAIQTQVAPSLGALCLLESYGCAWLKDISDRLAHYVGCPCRPPIDAPVSSGAVHEETGLQRNGTRSSLATNLD
ncbi:transposable element Tcb1 transposase [Trichonephila clavipes]|nr:transposable element Tcb1 transposase [Trichonephila clavipes]